jgi:hypothetical protein
MVGGGLGPSSAANGYRKDYLPTDDFADAGRRATPDDSY